MLTLCLHQEHQGKNLNKFTQFMSRSSYWRMYLCPAHRQTQWAVMRFCQQFSSVRKTSWLSLRWMCFWPADNRQRELLSQHSGRKWEWLPGNFLWRSVDAKPERLNSHSSSNKSSERKNKVRTSSWFPLASGLTAPHRGDLSGPYAPLALKVHKKL